MRCIVYFVALFLLYENWTVAAPKAESYVVEAQVVRPVAKFALERRYIGTIRAEKFSLLSPKVSGTVASIDVKPGQKVNKEQKLISLKSTSEKRGLEIAEKNLSLARKEFERNLELFKSQDITKSHLEKLERDLLTASSQLEEQKRLVENVEIRAPFDGVVGVPRVSLGETVQPQTPVVSVIDGPFFVLINIPGSRLNEVKVGQPVRIKSSTTTISAVEMSIDPTTRTGFAKAIFSSCDSCIVGDSVYAHITVHEKPQAILINRNAIFYKNSKPHIVAVVKGADGNLTADVREIVVGEEQEGQVEIVSGVKDGDEIIIANPKRVSQGAVVRVVK